MQHLEEKKQQNNVCSVVTSDIFPVTEYSVFIRVVSAVAVVKEVC